MADRYHSRVFVALAQMTDDLAAAPWPPHPVTDELPTVGVGNSDNPERLDTESDEFVDVVYRVEEDASVEWARIQGRDETFLVDVYIRSSVLGQDRAKAWGRLAELADVPQALYYDPDSRRFSPPDFPGVTQLGGLQRVTPQMWRTDEGWAGDCLVTFRIQARI